ncbi:MAG TPA: ribosome maturation factor RimM [Jatrophihabitans sp.]|nr:ribosome maturation factor RimM [Jatrophihabitans sp.]
MTSGTSDDRGEIPEDLVAVGRIGPARGVRGEVFVEPWTDAPTERFAAGAVLRTQHGGALTVAASSVSSGKQVVHFAGIDDRTAAESLRGLELFVPAGDRPVLPDPDEFYDTDLIGLEARTVGGQPLGPVRDVLHAGGASYLVVDIEGREHLIPFVAAIVPEVDLATATVTVDPPDGLFEL